MCIIHNRHIQSLAGHELLKVTRDNYNHEIYGDYSVTAKTKEEFKKLLLQTVYENLKQTFLETATHIIYQFLENKYSLKRGEIPENLETFMEGLNEFFHSGAYMIEQSNLKELRTILRLKYKSGEGYRFIDYMDDLENVYLP
jgi:hypothetical protein